MKKTIEPSSAALGATVVGVSLADMPDEETISFVETALERYGVLIFPNQQVTPKQQVDFSASFAPLELTELDKARLPGFPEIFVVGNQGKGLVSFAPESPGGELEWHTDHIHRKVAARASLLYALDVPETGGDTLFACMYSAYNDLSEKQKQQYIKLIGLNSSSGLEKFLNRQNLQSSPSSLGKRKYDVIRRPIVREHPHTKRRALYFGNQITIGIEGWSEQESMDFIKQLTNYACHEKYQYRHHWRKHDAVLWDNRRVLHAGTPYDVNNSVRNMHRTTWRETEPIELMDD